MFAEEGAVGLSAWFALWQDYNSRGIRSRDKWAEQYKASKHCNVSNAVSTISQYVGAIDRAVKKYGSLAKAKREHINWVNKADGYEFADITNFVKFAPEGQRAKNDTKLNKRAQKKKELMNAGFSAHAAETALNICGIK